MVSSSSNGWGSASTIQEELETTKKELESTKKKLDQYKATLRLAGTNIERRNRVIRALTSFPYQASRMTEPAALLKLGLSQALEMTEALVGAVVIIDSATKKLSLGAHEGLTPDLVRILTGYQFDEGAVTLMPHLVTGTGALIEDSESADEGERALLEAGQVSSLISLPLYTGDQLLGTLIAGTTGDARFSPASTHFLIAISQGIAVSLESLHLRERLWQMAETFLSQAVPMSADPQFSAFDDDQDLVRQTPILPPLQAKLADIIAGFGGTIGAIFLLDETKKDIQVTLAADYGLSPMFTNSFAQFRDSEGFFPFRHLLTHNLLVKHLPAVTTNQPMPLLISLQEEGAKSLIATCFHDSSVNKSRAIFVASPEPAAFIADHIGPLLAECAELKPLLTDLPPMPTLPTRSVHVPSMTLEAKEKDLELLLAAMMEAEEEVQRHTMDFAMLNEISEALSQSLDLEPVLNQVVVTIQQMLETDAIWLHLIDESTGERNKLHLAVHKGLGDEYAHGRLHLTLNDTIEGEVAQDNRPRYINDAAKGGKISELDGIQSVAIIPLSCPEIMVEGDVHRRVVGVLSVAMHKLHAWQPRQVRLLNTVANQMAFAINNAQLYTQVKEDMEAYSLSSQFLQKVNDSLMGVTSRKI